MSKSKKLLEQYTKVVSLMHEDAKKEGYAFFGYVYIRANDSIDDTDCISGEFLCNITDIDGYLIKKGMEKMGL